MNKKIGLALLIMGLPTVSLADEAVSSLPDGIKLYGRINISAQTDHDYNLDGHKGANNHMEDNFAYHSNASRVGAKGKTDLNEDVSLIYKAEYELNANNGYNSQNNFVMLREVYAGVSSKTLGTVEAGKIDTPLKMLQAKVDLFADYAPSDLKYLMPGKDRDSYTYLYKTPTFAGWSASYATINYREVQSKNIASPYYSTGTSMSLTYNKDGLFTDKDNFYFGLAHNNTVRDLDINRVAVQYKIGAFKFGALAQDAHKVQPRKTFSTGDRQENGNMLNAAWDVTQNDTIKIQRGQSQEVEYGGSQVSIGYDHKINKDLKVYLFHSGIGGDADMTNKPSKQKDRTLMANGVGVEYNF